MGKKYIPSRADLAVTLSADVTDLLAALSAALSSVLPTTLSAWVIECEGMRGGEEARDVGKKYTPLRVDLALSPVWADLVAGLSTALVTVTIDE